VRIWSVREALSALSTGRGTDETGGRAEMAPAGDDRGIEGGTASGEGGGGMA